MAVTAPADGEEVNRRRGRLRIDALTAAGRSFDADTDRLVYLNQADREAHRLFVLAAGNVAEAQLQADYLTLRP